MKSLSAGSLLWVHISRCKHVSEKSLKSWNVSEKGYSAFGCLPWVRSGKWLRLWKFSWDPLLCEMLSSRIMGGSRAEPGAGLLILPRALPGPAPWDKEEWACRLHVLLRVQFMRSLLNNPSWRGLGPTCCFHMWCRALSPLDIPQRRQRSLPYGIMSALIFSKFWITFCLNTTLGLKWNVYI